MKGSQELIAYFNKREEDLGEKATKFNLFLEGYAEGYNDTKALDETELAEVKKERDAYYDELLKLRQQKVEWIDKAKEWIETHTTIFDQGVSPESFVKDMSSPK